MARVRQFEDTYLADEKLIAILRKEYGYIVEEGYLLGQSELIFNKQKMNVRTIIDP